MTHEPDLLKIAETLHGYLDNCCEHYYGGEYAATNCGIYKDKPCDCGLEQSNLAPTALRWADAEIKEWEMIAEVRGAADRRAIERWQAETGRTLVWPDHADLCSWLMRKNEEQAATIAAQAAEIEQLRAWKESQLAVESKWDAQAVGREIGVGLGQDIRSAILPELQRRKAEIERLKAGGCARDQGLTQFCAEAVALRAEIEGLRGALTELLEVADLRGDSDLPHPSNDYKPWTARMQTAWDEARDLLKKGQPQ